jgi:hypothetical protein
MHFFENPRNNQSTHMLAMTTNGPKPPCQVYLSSFIMVDRQAGGELTAKVGGLSGSKGAQTSRWPPERPAPQKAIPIPFDGLEA